MDRRIHPSGDQRLSVGWYGDGCSSNPAQNVTGAEEIGVVPFDAMLNGVLSAGKLALISRTPFSPSCDYFTKVQNAQNAGAIGVIMYTDESEALIDMNCQGNPNRRLNEPLCNTNNSEV